MYVLLAGKARRSDRVALVFPDEASLKAHFVDDPVDPDDDELELFRFDSDFGDGEAVDPRSV